MKQKIYNKALEYAPFGYAYHKIILDDKSQPCDYEFVEVNKAFEKYTGLNRENIIGKKATEVFTDLIDDRINRISIFGDVAINGMTREFEQFFHGRNLMFNVKAISPQKYYFITYYTTISTEMQLISTAEKLLKYSTDDIDYHKITSALMGISGAIYGAFNLYDAKSKVFTTVASVGNDNNIKQTERIFGFSLTGRRWNLYPKNTREVGKNIITRFNYLHEFVNTIIPSDAKNVNISDIKKIEEPFNLGEIIVVKIIKDDFIMGHFFLIMPIGQQLMNEELVKLYARQTGLLLTHKQEEELIKESRLQYKVLFESTLAGIFVIDKETMKIKIANNTTARIFGLKSSEEAVNIKPMEYIHPLDKDNVMKAISEEMFEKDLRKPGEFRIITKDGRIIWIRVFGARIKYEEKTAGLISFHDITEQKLAEEDILNKNQFLGDLNQYSLVLNSASVNDVISLVAAKKMKELTKAIAVVISYFDDTTSELVIDYTTLSDKENNLLKSIIGRDIKGLRIKISGEEYNYIMDEVVITTDSFTKLTFGTISQSSGQQIKEVLNYKWLNGISLISKDKLIGTMVIIGGEESKQVDSKAFNAFADITANVLQRWFIEKSLMESERKFRNLSEICPFAIMIYQDDKFVYTNPAGENISGYSSKELYSMNYWDFAHQDYIDMVKEYMQGKKPEENDITPLDFKIIRKDGEERWVNITGNLIKFRKKPAGLISLIDVTEQKNIQKLQQEIFVARQSNQFKQNFLANMSHEIRTPLTGIMGMADLLSNTKLDDQQQDYLNTIKHSSENLKEIIDIILDYSKIEAGKAQLKKRNFSVKSLLKNAEKLFNSICKKDIEFETYISPSIPEYINTDQNRVNQIINNLLSNAVKNTNEGKIIINAYLESPEQSSKLNTIDEEAIIKIVVEDTGIGVNPDMRDFLFEPFSQIEQKDIRHFEGAGLGLAICKELTCLLGGQIDLESEPGKGSKFWFTFKAEVAKNDESNSIKSKQENNIRPLNILFVEDKRVTQKVILLMLESQGHKVKVLNNGKEALEKFEPGKYDIILMDIQMPVMDGITATKKLKEKHKDLPPIVGLSANAFEGDRRKYINQGMDEYLTKPLNIDELNSLIKELEIT